MGLLDDAIREHLDLKRRRGADPTEIERAEREALGPVRRGPEGRDQPEPPLDGAAGYEHEVDPDWHEPGVEHIPTGVVEPEPPPPDFAARPDAEDPFADHGGPGRSEPDPPELEFGSGEPQPEPLTLEESPRRRGFLGRRKQAPPPLEAEDHVEPPDYDDPFADDDPFASDDAGQPSGLPAPDSSRPSGSQAPDARPAAVERPGDPPGGETVEYEVEAALEAERQGEGDSDDMLEETPEFLQDTPDHDRLWFEQRPPRDFDFES